MENQTDLVLKIVLKNNSCIALFCDEPTLADLASHPKFLKMRDHSNDIYVSIEDVMAFEILNNRKDLQEANAVQQPTEPPSQ